MKSGFFQVYPPSLTWKLHYIQFHWNLSRYHLIQYLKPGFKKGEIQMEPKKLSEKSIVVHVQHGDYS